MILSFYGIEKTEEELAQLTGCTQETGVGADKLLEAAQELGLHGFIKDFAEFADVHEWVKNQQVPVIVDWFSQDDGHYAVVVDIDTENIYFLDPEIGHVRAMQLKKFKQVWFDFAGEFLQSKDDLIIRRIIVLRK